MGTFGDSPHDNEICFMFQMFRSKIFRFYENIAIRFERTVVTSLGPGEFPHLNSQVFGSVRESSDTAQGFVVADIPVTIGTCGRQLSCRAAHYRAQLY